jgi:hypothetical protein
MPEPESCLHPAESDGSLWAGLGQQATWLWNGYRGGLIVPARDLALVGLSPDAFLTLWAGRGADARAIEAGGHMAYELAGYYAFSDGSSDEVQRELRRRVRFLVDDAPALAVAINPNAPIIARDLSAEYRRSAGRATALVPLANAGKNLSRTPVVAVRFAPAEGTLILSQLLTQGRMAAGRGTPGPYGIGHDPAAVQVVLNMLARTV